MDAEEAQRPRHQDEGVIRRRPQGHSLSSAIVSGDSDADDEDIFARVGEYSTGGEEAEEALFRSRHDNLAPADELYDRNLDEEDEAYVYKNMRGGVHETVMVRHEDTAAAELDPQVHELLESSTPMKVYKARNSDAVLSCPCCFNIICMDCQRHQRYLTQFRAMFVMGVLVDWHSRLVYDEDQRILLPKAHQPNRVPVENVSLKEKGEVPRPSYEEGEYFPVHCANCKTQVAALDMTEEVYHFHGCLESS